MHRASLLFRVAGPALAALLVVAPRVALGQAEGARIEDFTLRIDVPVFSVDVSVTDRDGRPVTGLEVADFEILENGEPQPIRYFSSSTAPYHTYLLVDASGSTENKWPFMQQAVEAFVGALKAGDRISMGLFGHVLVGMSGWDDPRSKTIEALEPAMTLGPIPGTSEVYAAVEHVLDDGFDGIAERKALIVLTDGRDTSIYQDVLRRDQVTATASDKTFESLLETVARNGVPVYFVAVNTDRNRETNILGGDEYRNLEILYPGTDLPANYLEAVRERMEEVARVSGGHVVFPDSIEDLRAPFAGIARTLSQAYSLGYSPRPDPTTGAGEREIAVRVGRADLLVRQSRTTYITRATAGSTP
jgi:Ca-activated chloride channel family protein